MKRPDLEVLDFFYKTCEYGKKLNLLYQRELKRDSFYKNKKSSLNQKIDKIFV